MIMIGISEKDFQLTKSLGSDSKSYAYKSDGKKYNAKATGDEYGSRFDRYDVVGCGLIMQSKQIFYTLNGRFLRVAFSNVKIAKDNLYAAVCMQSINEEVQTNFTGSKSDPFIFDIEGFKREIAIGDYREISKIPVNSDKLHQMVQAYLTHYGYIETLQGIENDRTGQTEEFEEQQELQGFQEKCIILDQQVSECKETQEDFSELKDTQHPLLETQKSEIIDKKMTEDDQMIDDLAMGRQASQQSEISADDCVNQAIKRTTRSESFNVFQQITDLGGLSSSQQLRFRGRVQRSGSLYVEPRISDSVIQMSEKNVKANSTVYLKERGILRHMITLGEIDEAQNFIIEHFKQLYDTCNKMQACLHVLKFIASIKYTNLEEAVEICPNLQRYLKLDIVIPSKNKKEELVFTKINDIISLLCYDDPESSELGYLISDTQRFLIADEINNMILEFANKGKKQQPSQAELVMQHLVLTYKTLKEKRSSIGQSFQLKEMTDFINIGQQFVQHYYNTFDTARAGLKELYTAESMLSFEGEQFQGVQAILDKFGSFGQIRHDIKSFDAQPSVNSGIICFVSGDLYIDNSENPVKFAQVFQLFPGGSAGYFCYNDLFRLNYG